MRLFAAACKIAYVLALVICDTSMQKATTSARSRVARRIVFVNELVKVRLTPDGYTEACGRFSASGAGYAVTCEIELALARDCAIAP
jgi:hypothetical protein